MKYLLLFCLLAGAFATAQVAPSGYNVEKIEVSGLRYTTAEIVISASQLKENKIYDEPQLQKAMNRIKQLAFVRDAEFSLTKGSARGRYNLIIAITEFAPVFFDVASNYENILGDYDRTDDALNITGRWFFGRNNMVYATLVPDWSWTTGNPGPDVHKVRLGYTHYNLLNRGIFLNIYADANKDIRYRLSSNIDGATFQAKNSGQIDPTLELSVPIRPSHWLRLTSKYQATDSVIRQYPNDNQQSNHHSKDRQTSLSWEWNTTDDPWHPMQGMRLSAGGSFGNQQRESNAPDLNEPLSQSIRYSWSEDKTSLFKAEAERYFPIQARRSLMLKSAVSIGSNDSDQWGRNGEEINLSQVNSNIHQFMIKPGYRFSMWRQTPRQRWGDLFLDLETTFIHSRIHLNVWDGAFRRKTKTTSGHSSVNLTWRSSWGVARIGALYTWKRDSSQSLGGD